MTIDQLELTHQVLKEISAAFDRSTENEMRSTATVHALAVADSYVLAVLANLKDGLSIDEAVNSLVSGDVLLSPEARASLFRLLDR